MKKSKSVKTSQSERVTIVQDCIEHDYDYASIAKQYGVSYQQVYSWVKYIMNSDKGDWKTGVENEPHNRSQERKLKNCRTSSLVSKENFMKGP